jgi:hypothetical protein
MANILPFARSRQFSQRSYTAGRCGGCQAPLSDAADWLCSQCRGFARLASALSDFRRSAR